MRLQSRNGRFKNLASCRKLVPFQFVNRPSRCNARGILFTTAALLAIWLLPGCTVVSANRTFPKLSWYWSAEAKEQRRENQAQKHLVDPTKFSP